MAKYDTTQRTRGWPLDRKLAHYCRPGRQLPGVEGRCLEWTGYTDENGYGILYWRGDYYRAHRLAWMHKHGEPPADAPHILHQCDNPACIRRKHLRAGTHSDNMTDRAKRKRHNVRGTRNGRAKLTERQVHEIRLAVGSQATIAGKYGVGQSTVSRIKRGENWAVGGGNKSSP